MTILAFMGLVGLFMNLLFNYNNTKNLIILNKNERIEEAIKNIEELRFYFSIGGNKLEAYLVAAVELTCHIIFSLYAMFYIGNIYLILFSIIKIIVVTMMIYNEIKSMISKEYEVKPRLMAYYTLCIIYHTLDTVYLITVIYNLIKMF